MMLLESVLARSSCSKNTLSPILASNCLQDYRLLPHMSVKCMRSPNWSRDGSNTFLAAISPSTPTIKVYDRWSPWIFKPLNNNSGWLSYCATILIFSTNQATVMYQQIPYLGCQLPHISLCWFPPNQSSPYGSHSDSSISNIRLQPSYWPQYNIILLNFLTTLPWWHIIV